ncbi:MAG: serine/threonine protein kinase [Myxococcales bacterium]|nr:serine/threonine protein kinase [Myxococcales bacterium]
MEFEPGHVVGGRYRLVRPLATGGMGAIWVARHVELDIEVAIKFVLAEQAGDARALKRFRREARTAAGLSSEHVVRVLDFGVDDEKPYLAMELLEGEDLLEHLETHGRLSPERVAILLRQLSRGLEVAHDAGIVHRDLKPSNLFLARTGKSGADEVLKILDFGVARSQALQREADATDSVGVLLGSPPYMSPEQARAGSVDHRTDLWAVGAISFEMLTGHRLFAGGNLADTVAKICSDPIPRVSDHAAELGSCFDEFFRRALERDPGLRFQSASELCAAFEAAAGLPSASATKAPAPRGRDSETLSVRVEGSTFDPVQGGSQAVQSRSAPRLGWLVAGVTLAALGATLAVRQLTRVELQAEAPAAAPVPMPSMASHPAAATPPHQAPAGPPASAAASSATVEAARAAPRAKSGPAPRSAATAGSAAPATSAQPKVDPIFGLPTGSP